METVREAGPGGTSITVRKTAFCDQHTPADSDARPRLDDVSALGITTPNSKKSRSPKKAIMEQHPLPILFRGLMNFSPQCPWDKVQKIAGLVDIQKKNHHSLKSPKSVGLPSDESSQGEEDEEEEKEERESKKEEKKEKKEQKLKKLPMVEANIAQFKKMSDERRRMRRLRHDLERVRLLCELIRKRRLRHDLERVRLLCE